VANSRLYRAAVEFGLDRYIIHKTFSLHKWRPTYVEDLLENPPSATETRRLPSKTLADVVEALIGAAYISGGTSKALACMSLFIPEFKWCSIEHGREVLCNEAPDDEPLPATMRPLESLIGYTFNKKSLLVEAMTHPSCNGPSIRASLDRLEFLGDAILDYIIVKALFSISSPSPLENSDLHLLRTALVNADILGFLAMEWAINQDRFDVVTTSTPTFSSTGNDANADAHTNVSITPSQTRLPLPSFLRHASPDLGLAQRAAALRHARLREAILHALWHGPHYPWALLCRLQAHKFHSDAVEALLGAVWVDSIGDDSNGDGDGMAACEAVAERIGILKLMRRLVADRVWLLHPKEELGRLSGSSEVEYIVTQQVVFSPKDGPEGEAGEAGERMFRCEVKVGGVVAGTAEGGLSREEARTRAAEDACARLKGEREGEGDGSKK